MTNELHDVHASHLGKIRTYTGKVVDLQNPTVDMISTEDIAQALSNICRFGGQIGYHYTVLAHSMRVVELAPKHLRYAALLHDASEAYLGDVIKPLKVILGSVYADLEAKWMSVIGEKYRIGPADFEEVKWYDRIALEYEDKFFRDKATSGESVMIRTAMLSTKKMFIHSINYWYAKSS